MKIKKPKYESLRELLAIELVIEEDRSTSELIKSLRHVQKDKVLSKEELLMICKWKSPRTRWLCKIWSDRH